MSEEKKYWFPAKQYGWGWGCPSCWQGWAVLAAYVFLLVVGAVILPPDDEVGLFLAYCTVLTVLLIAVCWLKGEPPGWRWGG